MAETKQIRFCGFGGQGVVLGGKILGNASISAGKWVAGLSTYGGAARGGVCEADIVISDESIVFPQVVSADIMIAMSQSAYDKNIKTVNKKTGLVVYDSDLVTVKPVDGLKQIGIPATETAVKDLNNKQAANMVILGAVVGITGVITRDALAAAVEKGVRERFRELNLKAIDLGFKLGKEALSKAK